MLLDKPKILPTGVTATWQEIVRTDMDYNTKTSKATVYYYLDEKAFNEGKESLMGEIIDVPYVEQEELKKVDVTAKVLAEAEMVKVKVVPNEKPVK